MRKIYLSQVFGVAGGSMSFTAFAIVMAQTASPLHVAVLSGLPFLVLPFDLLSGLVLDKVNRRTVLLLGVALRAGILLLLALVPHEPMVVLVLALMFQAILALDLPAWHTIVPRMFPKSLEIHGGRIQAAQLLGNSVGALLGPLLLAVRAMFPFLFGGTLLLLEASLLQVLPEDPPPRTGRQSIWRSVWAGAGFLLEPTLRLLTLYTLALGFLSGLALALLPILALHKGTPAGLYGLYPAALSAGGFLGGVFAGGLTPDRAIWGGHAARLIGLLLLLLPFPFGIAGGLLHGIGTVAGGVHLRAYRQRLAPDEILGRVQAASVAILSLGGLLGTAVAGALGHSTQAVLFATLGLLALLPLGFFGLAPSRLVNLKDLSRRGDKDLTI